MHRLVIQEVRDTVVEAEYIDELSGALDEVDNFEIWLDFDHPVGVVLARDGKPVNWVGYTDDKPDPHLITRLYAHKVYLDTLHDPWTTYWEDSDDE